MPSDFCLLTLERSPLPGVFTFVAMYNPPMLNRLLACAAVALVVAGCARSRDVQKDLKLVDVHTGWYDAGIVNGQNKLVPSITITVRNASSQKLPVVQLNALFRRVNEPDEWGSAFVTAAGSEGLAPGATTQPLQLKSNLGYTGADQSREEMLHNSHFVDAKVELFAKYGSQQPTRMGEYPITRQLLTK